RGEREGVTRAVWSETDEERAGKLDALAGARVVVERHLTGHRLSGRRVDDPNDARAARERDLELPTEEVVEQRSGVAHGPRNQIASSGFVRSVIEDVARLTSEDLSSKSKALPQRSLGHEVRNRIAVGGLAEVPTHPQFRIWLEEPDRIQAVAAGERELEEDREVAEISAVRVFGHSQDAPRPVGRSGPRIDVAVDEPRHGRRSVEVFGRREDRCGRSYRWSSEEGEEMPMDLGVLAGPHLVQAAFVAVAVEDDEVGIVPRVGRHGGVLDQV